MERFPNPSSYGSLVSSILILVRDFFFGSLSQYGKKHKDVSTKAIKNWARQILRGLHYLHTHEPPIVLGDLKCDNIFVNGNNGEVKIGDLGLAIVTQQPPGLSDLGTPACMAPELCEDEYNELVDVYSFGMCTLEMVTCEYPYCEIKNPGQVYKKVISGVKPASLNKVNDPQVKQFIEKCLVPASLRLPAIELLKDPFLATENSKDTVSGSMKLPNNLMPKQVSNLPHSESRSMDTDEKKLLVGSCKESIDEKLQFSTLEICKFTEKNEFRLRGEKIDSNTISLNLNITETSCSLERKVEFPFHLDSDTAVSVAEEMMVPSWKTSRGSIANAPERQPDCLQSVRDQEALQSINLEISAEHYVTISFCASTNKPLGSSHCSLQLNAHNLVSDFRTHDDGRLPVHKKSARRFLGFCIGSCFGMKNMRAGPASATHTKQRKLTRSSNQQTKALKMASCSLITPASSLASSSLRKLFSSRNSMATVGLLSFAPKTSSFILHSIKQRAYHESSFRVRSVAAPVEDVAGFDDMVAGTQRKYYMLGGKGGVGKTSCAASLAVKFANSGHPTLVVSTDPAHSLSDSFAQDLTGGTLVPVEGPEYPLFALEINPDKSREEFRSATQKSGGTGVKDFMEGMGLGMLVEQLGELKLGELLDTPPPGLDEAIAIAKVMQFLESPEYSMFTRIVFDTAPTGHTLRLLSLPDFLDASIGKILKLRQKITSATSAIKSVFGQEQTGQQDAAYKLEQLRERMIKVRELFRDTDATEFVIVTIPTNTDSLNSWGNISNAQYTVEWSEYNGVMAISESSRLRASLKKENVPVKRLVVNQILPPSTTDCKFCAMKRKDQLRALDMIQNDPELSSLTLIQGPLVDVEIRGVPALKFLGDIIWK
ncbi:hypothetical protein NC651_019567 [Populus alba x Populus x berolinensis]|nr:hypothetical protein NC651_019567 [Populus alba x Populus x berolinensis]